jgi:peptidoglycan L-alanyl-D-glutamate endopeptidase CwlK
LVDLRSLREKFESAIFHPKVRQPLADLRSDLVAKGWKPEFRTTYRTLRDQQVKYILGYSKERFGYHNVRIGGIPQSLAVDVIDKRYGWNAPKKFWADVGQSAQKHGLAWGGNWKNFPDVAHVQASGKWATQLMANQRRVNRQAVERERFPAMLDAQREVWRAVNTTRIKGFTPQENRLLRNTMNENLANFYRGGRLQLRFTSPYLSKLNPSSVTVDPNFKLHLRSYFDR